MFLPPLSFVSDISVNNMSRELPMLITALVSFQHHKLKEQLRELEREAET